MAESKDGTRERGYGNIYTPHAGAMIIHVQRESGLANRTLIFTQRQVRLFRIGAIVLGSLIAFGAVSWFFLAAQAARVPYLTRRVASVAAQCLAPRHAAAFAERARRTISAGATHDGKLVDVTQPERRRRDTSAQSKTPTVAAVAVTPAPRAAPVDSIVAPR